MVPASPRSSSRYWSVLAPPDRFAAAAVFVPRRRLIIRWVNVESGFHQYIRCSPRAMYSLVGACGERTTATIASSYFALWATNSVDLRADDSSALSPSATPPPPSAASAAAASDAALISSLTSSIAALSTSGRHCSSFGAFFFFDASASSSSSSPPPPASELASACSIVARERSRKARTSFGGSPPY